MKIITILLLFFTITSCTNNKKTKIKKMEAIAIARKEANGILGTWIDSSIKNKNWHISTYSKSVNPPRYYVIDSESGEVLLRLDNTDKPNQNRKLNDYLKKENKNQNK